MNNTTPDVESIYKKMNDEKLRFTDGLVDEIIDYTAEDIALSEIDVRDLAIYTLYSIVVLGNNAVASPIIKKSLCEIVGDSANTIEFLGSTLGAISSTDDVIADRIFEKMFANGGVANGEC